MNYDYLEEIERVGSTISKEVMLRSWLTVDPEAEDFLRLAFNESVYGLDEKTFYNAFSHYHSKIDPAYQSVSDFLYVITGETELSFQSLERFARTLLTLSGNDLSNNILMFFEDLVPLQKKWSSRALLHDLRMGVQVKTVNKVFKQLKLKTIEKFALQLCDKLDVLDPEDVKKKITFPCSMECKYDGIRLQADIWTDHVNDDPSDLTEETRVTLTSRRGKDNTEKYPEIVKALAEVFEGQTLTLDGEIISRSFQSLTRKDDTSAKKYVIFDLLVAEKLPYKDRWENLVLLLSEVGITEVTFDNNNLGYKNTHETILMAEHHTAGDISDLQAYYTELNERQEEGLIIKNYDKPYVRGSRKNMFKCKKVYTADLLITGWKFGEGKRTNMVSTLCLRDLSGTVTVDVGSGIDDYTSNTLTESIPMGEVIGKPDWIGKICEIKYNEITETGSIRFPRFVCIREDKETPDDLSTSEVRQQ
jgi:ATP-dependent DNA ligase